MEMYQKNRFILIFALVFVGMLLFKAWQEKQSANEQPDPSRLPQIEQKKTLQNTTDLPKAPAALTNQANQTADLRGKAHINVPKARQVRVKTNVFDLVLDRQGGDIIRLSLPQYPISLKDKTQGHVLLQQNEQATYIIQSGLLAESGPDSPTLGRSVFQTSQENYVLEAGQKRLNVDLKFQTQQGVDITKRFMFERDSYIVKVAYIIHNASDQPYFSRLYGRIKRTEGDAGSGLGMRAFSGAAMNMPDKKYKKMTFKALRKEPTQFHHTGGWIAMVDHYFLSAFVPNQTQKNYFQTENLEAGLYAVGFMEPEIQVAPGETKTLSTTLYMGPENTEVLETLSPGLELTADYGILWPICQPIFWLLKKIYTFVGNWGVAIILITVLIKGLFYHLSAASYRSMGRMRQLQPRIEALKARFGDDRQKMGQAVMALYKTEKINPLGGCLPILVQIPVFIALYYVLLGSVELRQAPFAFWILDLSAKDPFYVLPLLMGASMWFQQKLNPTPPDPIQAKVMMAMPIVFTVIFLQFPSGLVLYWFVNNMLSIAQQWLITRRLEQQPAQKKR